MSDKFAAEYGVRGEDELLTVEELAEVKCVSEDEIDKIFNNQVKDKSSSNNGKHYGEYKQNKKRGFSTNYEGQYNEVGWNK